MGMIECQMVVYLFNYINFRTKLIKNSDTYQPLLIFKQY